jgi:hypothetical protein
MSKLHSDAPEWHSKLQHLRQVRWAEYKAKRESILPPGFDEMKKNPAAVEFLSHLKTEHIFRLKRVSSAPTHIFASLWSPAGKPGISELNKRPPLQSPKYKRYEKLVQQENIQILDPGTRSVLGTVRWVRGQGEPFFCRSGDEGESADSLLAAVEANARKELAGMPYELETLENDRGCTFRVADYQADSLAKAVDALGTIAPELELQDVRRNFEALMEMPEACGFIAKFEPGTLHFELAGKVELKPVTTKVVQKEMLGERLLVAEQNRIIEKMMLTETKVSIITGSGQPVAMAKWVNGEGHFFQNFFEDASQAVDAILSSIADAIKA